MQRPNGDLKENIVTSTNHMNKEMRGFSLYLQTFHTTKKKFKFSFVPQKFKFSFVPQIEVTTFLLSVTHSIDMLYILLYEC